MLEILAPAKINLVLEILARRQDGYHGVSTLLQTISLYDHLWLEETDREDILTAEPDHIATPDNLVLRALAALRQYGHFPYLRVHLKKNIPIAAGLGGGSSDAASVLREVTRRYALPINQTTLGHIASRLGADVPFFLEGGLQWGTGRGDLLQPCPVSLQGRILLYNPGYPLSTVSVFEQYAQMGQTFDSGQITARFLSNVSGGIEPIYGYNALWPVVAHLCPDLVVVKRKFADVGINMYLSGSGPTLWGLVDAESQKAAEVAQLVQESRVWYCEFV